MAVEEVAGPSTAGGSGGDVAGKNKKQAENDRRLRSEYRNFAKSINRELFKLRIGILRHAKGHPEDPLNTTSARPQLTNQKLRYPARLGKESFYLIYPLMPDVIAQVRVMSLCLIKGSFEAVLRELMLYMVKVRLK